MNIGQFNARGPDNGIEHWFDLIHDELIKQGHNVRQFWFRGNQPSKKDIEWMDFALYHFSQVGLYYRRLGVPFCVLPSANDFFPDKGERLRMATNHRDCKFVTYQSAYHNQKYDEWDIPKPKVYVPMPVRTELFKRTKDIPNGENIIAGGRLIHKKGLDRIMHLKHLTIFGEGPLINHLRLMNMNVKFTGYLNGEELRDLMDEAWIFLHPAIETPDGDREGISNLVKEALLMRLQVICSPVGGLPELENVMLFDDWDNIEECIKTVPKQPNYKGEKEIRHLYNPTTCVNMLLRGIEEYA